MNGKKYWFDTPKHGRRIIGVERTGSGSFAVCYHAFTELKFDKMDMSHVATWIFKNPNLPVCISETACQRALDQFAAKRKLEVAEDGTDADYDRETGRLGYALSEFAGAAGVRLTQQAKEGKRGWDDGGAISDAELLKRAQRKLEAVMYGNAGTRLESDEIAAFALDAALLAMFVWYRAARLPF